MTHGTAYTILADSHGGNTHTQHFMALLDFVRDYLGEQVKICNFTNISIRIRFTLKKFIITTSPPQSHPGRAHRHPAWQRMDSPASCATSCMKRASPRNTHCRQIQSLSHGYATSTQQSHMHPVYYTALAV